MISTLNQMRYNNDKHMTRWSVPLTKCKSTTMIRHSTTTRMIKRTDNIVLREDVEQLEHTPRGNENGRVTLEKNLAVSS